jgi:hypothetical protein
MISNFRANVNKNVRMEKESFLVGVGCGGWSCNFGTWMF